MDHPPLFQAADAASVRAQRLYLRIIRANLAVSLIGAAVGLLSPRDPLVKAWLAIAATSLLTIGVLCAFVLRIRKYERRWYGGRAAAESAKTLSWRYMMRAQPFAKPADREADEEFLKHLRSMLTERKNLAGAIEPALGNIAQITPAMRALRALPLQDRVAKYISERIEGQRKWYAEKAHFNQREEEKLFWVFVAAQIAAVVTAGIKIKYPEMTNFTAVFVACSTAAMSWLQVKKHQELGQAYAIASHELSLISAAGIHIVTETDLSNFVVSAEDAISREHTLWIAKRDSE